MELAGAVMFRFEKRVSWQGEKGRNDQQDGNHKTCIKTRLEVLKHPFWAEGSRAGTGILKRVESRVVGSGRLALGGAGVGIIFLYGCL